jgi:histidinol phosphatase-like enzyme (inositol monophosphatase family)
MADAAFLKHLAGLAASQTLPRFRAATAVSDKGGGRFDPVTEADREAERAIRAAIAAHYPEHGIIGEEFGQLNADAEHVWVIDPVDGTRAFISGVPVWGTLIGLLHGGRAVHGIMAQPFTGEVYYTDGTQSRYEGPGGERVLRTRETGDLAEAIMFTTTPALFSGTSKSAYDRLEASVRLARYGTDCYGYVMVASGQADLVCEIGLQSYDIVALIPIIEKAGGVVTDWRGGRAENGGAILASANPRLHEAALAVLNR